MNIYPSREEFQELASTNTVIPVWTEMLADVETPVAAYMKLVGDKPGFLLESVDHGERWSRYSFVGRDPLATLTGEGGGKLVHSGSFHSTVIATVCSFKLDVRAVRVDLGRRCHLRATCISCELTLSFSG